MLSFQIREHEKIEKDLNDIKPNMEQDLNRDLIMQTLGFHGLPLIKSWNEEKGGNNLIRLGIQQNSIDTAVYNERLKVLNFTDRTKRLRLHRFICNKSESLFKNFREDPVDRRIKKLVSSGGNHEKNDPPECFLLKQFWIFRWCYSSVWVLRRNRKRRKTATVLLGELRWILSWVLLLTFTF